MTSISSQTSVVGSQFRSTPLLNTTSTNEKIFKVIKCIFKEIIKLTSLIALGTAIGFVIGWFLVGPIGAVFGATFGATLELCTILYRRCAAPSKN